MLKSNKVVLLKAVAMSALLVNGCISTDSDDKYNKQSDKPSHNSSPSNLALSSNTLGWHASHHQHAVAEILAPLDERAKIAREVLSKPRNIDFAIMSIDTALKLLSYAKQYSVKLRLNLLNITSDDLNRILSENDGNIEELEWSFTATPVSATDNIENNREKKYYFDTWYDVDDEEDFKTEDTIRHIRNNSQDKSEKYIDDDDYESKKYFDSNNKKYKYIEDDKYEKGNYLENNIKNVKYIEDGEDADDLMLVEDEDDKGSQPNFLRDRFPNLNKNFHPNDVDNLPIRRRSASRGLRAPDLRELLNNGGNKGTPLLSPESSGINNGIVPLKEINSMGGSWKFTTLRNDMQTQEPLNSLTTSDHLKPPKQPNLVRFYCHQDPLLVRAR